MVKINLLLANLETTINMDIESSSDLNNFIKNDLGLENFILKLEDGGKITSKNLLLIDDYLKNIKQNTNEENKETYILLELNKKLKIFESSGRNSLLEKFTNNVQIEFTNFVNFLKKNNYKLDFVEKTYFETLRIIENSKKIKSQLSIYDFYVNFYKKEVKNLKGKINKVSEFLSRMNHFNDDVKDNLEKKYLKNLKELKFGNVAILDIIEDAKVFKTNLLDSKYKEFYKSLFIIDQKYNDLDKKFNLSEASILDKLSNLKAIPISYEFDDFIKTQLEYFLNVFRKFISDNSFTNIDDKTLFSEFLASFENFWKNLNESFIKEEINKISVSQEENSKIIKSLINNDFDYTLKELKSNYKEIRMLKDNIQKNYDYLNIPIIVSNQYIVLENEIIRRKKYDYIFNEILVLLKEKFIEKEEEYINNFNSKMSQSSKNPIYVFLFKYLYENYSFDIDNIQKKLNSAIEQTNSCLNNIFNELIKVHENNYSNKSKNKIIDINSVINFDLDLKDNQKYSNINEKYQNINKNSYENINEIGFEKNNFCDINIVKLNINENNNRTDSNISKITNQKLPENYNNNIQFEEYENILNNLNQKISGVQKELNLLLKNTFKYSEKDLFQIDSNNKINLKNVNSFDNTNILYHFNNDIYQGNYENKNFNLTIEDSILETNKFNRKKNMDETFNIFQKNNMSCQNLLNSFTYNNLYGNFVYTLENILSNIQIIKGYIKLISMTTDNKSKNKEEVEDDLDISMNSLINSIYISKVIQNEKNRLNDFTEKEEIKKHNEINLIKEQKNYEFNNENAEISAFLKMHVHKIYFYDDVYEMLQNFIDKKKIKYQLIKDNPVSIGKFIESLINKFIKVTNEYPKLIKKIMETFKKK